MVDTIRLTGDQEADMAAIAAIYQGHLGYHPRTGGAAHAGAPALKRDRERQAGIVPPPR
ncbi:hypothetical protein LP420_02135 [Massilia sp. B-10]|nr:hypothetical protein LP420_02135 [Massilia sp. B-10]